MTEMGSGDRQTAHEILFDGADARAAAQCLAAVMNVGGVMKQTATAFHGLSEGTRAAAVAEVSAVASNLLDLDLGDIAFMAWRKATALLQAAERTAAAPGSEEVVELGTHRITSVHHPAVRLLIDGVNVHTVRFELTIVLEVEVLAAVVRDGSIVDLHVGSSSATATLIGDGCELINKQRALNARWVTHLGTGVPLLPRPPRRPTDVANGNVVDDQLTDLRRAEERTGD